MGTVPRIRPGGGRHVALGATVAILMMLAIFADADAAVVVGWTGAVVTLGIWLYLVLAEAVDRRSGPR
ncbi:hypothetical protein EHW97_13030 [Aeromicrobium camelliae]|uniref:Uncharacterized protein n=1 Tax=Aeromicrobium camelliae TaxID=1538144 RepID=A0A3N6WMC8_9ACTN|nr:hypothetical protein [Aeromicrobium camelliae]RQN02483.1 hypothetical protein EHW97_13030 [Aeromicrobium camelliae]